MKKTRKKQRLMLNKQTIASLDARELINLHGGYLVSVRTGWCPEAPDKDGDGIRSNCDKDDANPNPDTGEFPAFLI